MCKKGWLHVHIVCMLMCLYTCIAMALLSYKVNVPDFNLTQPLLICQLQVASLQVVHAFLLWFHVHVTWSYTHISPPQGLGRLIG